MTMMNRLGTLFAAGCIVACGGGADGELGPDAGPAVDAGLDDGGADASPDAPGTEPTARVLYPLDRRHSPITDEVVARLATMAAAPRANQVFMKVGDSI